MQRPFQSNIPSAIDALVALLTARFAGVAPAVLVKDGPFISEEASFNVISVGWSGFHRGYEYPSRSMSEELGAADAESTNEVAGMGGGQFERFAINCAALSRSGTDPNNANTSANRANCYGLITTLATFVEPPGPYLNGSAMRVLVGGDTKLYQVVDNRGLLAMVTFNLMCEAFSRQ